MTDLIPAAAAPARLAPWAERARNAAEKALSEDRMTRIFEKQAQLAEDGDPKALKFVMDLMGRMTPESVEVHEHHHHPPSEAVPAARRLPSPDASVRAPEAGAAVGGGGRPAPSDPHAELRRAAVSAVAAGGRMSAAQIAKRTGSTALKVETALSGHPWFRLVNEDGTTTYEDAR